MFAEILTGSLALYAVDAVAYSVMSITTQYCGRARNRWARRRPSGATRTTSQSARRWYRVAISAANGRRR